MNLLVGTSGYSYKEWKGVFYPDDLPAGQMLGHYAGRLPAVEINNTFYRLPKESVLESWAEQVPGAFRFAIKASRRITHLKRLKDPADEVEYLFRVLAALGARLGCVLFQLPPNMKKDLDRLDAFLALLAPGARCAFEFRNASWMDDDVLGRLRDGNHALVAADTDEQPIEEIVSTADWGYVRLRREAYDTEALRAWSTEIGAQQWGQAFIFFKHEDAGAGPKLASELLEIVGA